MSTTVNIEIESRDVIKLVLQFLQENNLTRSLRTLQTESNVPLNSVENLESFVTNIYTGRWEIVLSQLSLMKLPSGKLASIYEQVVFELLEAGEMELAKEILRSTEPLILLKREEPQRFLKIEKMCQKQAFNPSEAYEMGSSRDKRRREIAESLIGDVNIIPPSRLLALVGQALRNQGKYDLLPHRKAYDIFHGGKRASRREGEEKLPRKQLGQIMFGLPSHPETAVFSPDGQNLLTGSYDGFIELWDFNECKLRFDLDYQARDELMMHEDAILCSTFTRDAELLATGSKDGMIKVWRVSTGVCIRKITKAHPLGITSLNFSRDGSHILSTSFDGNLRLHGLKSGKTLKEFRGHSSFVNCALFGKDGIHILSGSSDGTIRIWDQRTSECVMTYRPGGMAGIASSDLAVHTLQLMPNNLDHIMVVAKCPYVFIISTQGQLIKSFSSGKMTGGDFLCATVSPQGKWIYCIGEDGIMYMFNTLTGKLENFLQVSDREIIGIAHHPYLNLVCTITDHGQLSLWKP